MMQLDVLPVRSALEEFARTIAQESNSSLSGVPPASTFVPPSHARAIDVNTTLVEGIRGAGKSFWWSALLSEPHRKFVTKAFPSVRLEPSTDVRQAFGAELNPSMAPGPDTIEKLLKSHQPKNIWKAVIATHAELENPFPDSTANWQEKTDWVSNNPELYDELLWKADERAALAGQTRLILFDALDRLSDDWSVIRLLVRSLLQVALSLRSTRCIRTKLFLRPDMLEDREITGFPDFSKLNATKASLIWRRQDLYGLLFQRLGNSVSSGQVFRDWSANELAAIWTQEENGWVVPARLARDEEAQEMAFIAIAGPAMGKGPSGIKRGKPYSWLVNHLVDGRAQVSPRSFLSAIGKAADETQHDYSYVISARGIQDGVQQASKIRVDELISEDYPWIKDLMDPLRGLTVPCASEDIIAAWSKSSALRQLERSTKGAGSLKLPPRRLEEGPAGVLQDLQELGLIQILSDGRIQMPDVYRIAFGLGRRGGVKPLG